VGYKKPVLSGLSFSFPQGSFVSVLGSNGVGKSTLLRTLSRHLPPLGGEIKIRERPLSGYSASEFAKVVSVVMTDRASPPLLRVLEYVGLGRHPHTGFLGKLRETDVEVVLRCLADVKARHLSDRFVDQLSDGERQKVSLARALAQEPRLMLLDEPTAHLDLKHRVELMGILRGLCREKSLSVLAAVHDVDVAAKVSDQVLALKDGGLTSFGPPQEVLSSRFVSKLYDFEKAGYSSHLGGIEIRGDGSRGRVFVLTEKDRGAQSLRHLSKHGYALKVGVPERHDLDAYVAGALGAEVLTRDSRGGKPEEILRKAFRSLEDCDFLVDALGPEAPNPPGGEEAPGREKGNDAPFSGGGRPDGGFYRRELLREASRLGLTIISLGPGGDAAPLARELEERGTALSGTYGKALSGS
jgi:iron complex transport system ATP-binding protein